MGLLGSWEFSGGPGHVHICLCVPLLRGVPGRHEYIWLLAGLGAGPVRIFCPFGSVLACVCLIEQVGGVAGQYDFPSILCFLLAGRYD